MVPCCCAILTCTTGRGDERTHQPALSGAAVVQSHVFAPTHTAVHGNQQVTTVRVPSTRRQTAGGVLHHHRSVHVASYMHGVNVFSADTQCPLLCPWAGSTSGTDKVVLRACVVFVATDSPAGSCACENPHTGLLMLVLVFLVWCLCRAAWTVLHAKLPQLLHFLAAVKMVHRVPLQWEHRTMLDRWLAAAATASTLIFLQWPRCQL